MIEIIPIQEELRQELPEVIGNVDYKVFRETLERIEEIIETGRFDEIIIRHLLEEAAEAKREDCRRRGREYKGLTCKEHERIQKRGRQAFRCVVARALTGDPYRVFSCRLADSRLFQRFCLIETIDKIKVPSKSELARYDRIVPESIVREIIKEATVLAGAQAEEDEKQILGLETPINLDEYFADTTCVKANIHFPIDWVLLRDAIRTLMKAVVLIRQSGLINRMTNIPEEFIRQINRLSMQMTHARRKKDSKKERKRVLRLMKKLMKKIRVHAERHRDMLESDWQTTELQEGHVRQIVKRIDKVLKQLPEAIRQAHERIIGGRCVKNTEKILSLYEEELHVVVRGKAGAEVEFGNTLFLGEQADGLIVDWKLYRDQAPSDDKLVEESLERIKTEYGGYKPQSITTDRGFYSYWNTMYLKGEGIEDYMCPRSVPELQERLKDPVFCEKQARRGQTEGRIGILKNNFLGKPMRSKGFGSRELNVAWCVLAHNLWVLARLPKAEEKEKEKAA